jgi:hypothetical protein
MAYPSDWYYDPQRPAWMPYWLDTLSEEALKFGAYPGVDLQRNYPRPPAAPAPAPPPVSTSTAANNDPSLPAQAGAATRARFEEWTGVTLPRFFGGVDRETQNDEDAAFSPMYLLYGGLAVGVVLLLRGRR